MKSLVATVAEAFESARIAHNDLLRVILAHDGWPDGGASYMGAYVSWRLSPDDANAAAILNSDGSVYLYDKTGNRTVTSADGRLPDLVTAHLDCLRRGGRS